jgi:hypothetical protein
LELCPERDGIAQLVQGELPQPLMALGQHDGAAFSLV